MVACSSDDGDTPGPAGGGTAGSAVAGTSSAGTSSNPGGSPSVTGGAAGSTSVGGGGSSAAAGGGAGGASGGSASTGGSDVGGSVSGGSGGATGGSNAGGSAGVACPADATFCADFEEEGLPTGAVYKVNAAPGEWSRDFEMDSTVARSGRASLRVKSGSADTGTSGSAYQMLAVPAPSGAFWARFYIRQADLDIGGLEHNVFAGASSSDEPNAAGMVEFAEDVGVSFNTSDAVRWPMNYGRINGNPMPYSLPKGMWHCIELSFDGTARVQKLYIDGELKIDATDYPASVAMPLKIFKFGFNKLHGPARSVWYDDVAVGPTRPGCL